MNSRNSPSSRPCPGRRSGASSSTETDRSRFNFQHVVYRPKQIPADELNRCANEAWHEFYSNGSIVRRLLRTRPPVTRGNLMVWALNFGIGRIVRQYGRPQPVRDPNQPASVFEQIAEEPAAPPITST